MPALWRLRGASRRGRFKSSPGADFAPYTAAFDHSHEQAHPGYYDITLANGVRVELTVTERAGIARFTFPAGRMRACS